MGLGYGSVADKSQSRAKKVWRLRRIKGVSELVSWNQLEVWSGRSGVVRGGGTHHARTAHSNIAR